MLLSYKPLHLEAQQRLQEEGCVVDINAQPSNDNDVETKPAVDLDNPQSKNQCYNKRDFVARK